VSGKALLGFCRLRLPGQSLRKEIPSRTAIVRELHVYGEAAGIGKKGKVQHTGLGKRLLAKAQQTARKAGAPRIIVISGVGAREYYRKQGYVKRGQYMTKNLG
jgi:elongator complex protein 3